MEAICRPDFFARVKAFEEAEAAREKAKKANKPFEGILVPVVGFYEYYGVWFFGQLKDSICKIALSKFKSDIKNAMHVFIDIESKAMTDGIHELTVYGSPCRLYKWTAQGYHRGLVVLADDEKGNADAEVYLNSKTWSWELNYGA